MEHMSEEYLNSLGGTWRLLSFCMCVLGRGVLCYGFYVKSEEG